MTEPEPEASPVPAPFDAHDLYVQLQPFLNSLRTEAQVAPSASTEATTLHLLHESLHHALQLGFLVHAIRRETGGMSIEWKEPPPKERAGRQLSQRPVTDTDVASRVGVSVVAALQAAPGRWALVQTSVSFSVAAAWKKLGCEAVARKSPTVPRKADIYARWPE